jgi:hypothetical protein
LQFRYGDLAGNLLRQEGRDGLKHASIWWRDIWRLGCEEDGGWFSSNISSIIGDGGDIGFWKEKWMGTLPLRDLFPELFSKTTQPDGFVAQMGSWDDEVWTWNLGWNAALTGTEIEKASYLLTLLNSVQPKRNERDKRRWIAHTAGLFSVQSAYTVLMTNHVHSNNNDLAALDDDKVLALQKLWKNNVPSKVSIFGWRLLLEKLPTRESLFHKGIITSTQERHCVFCFNWEENIDHIFMTCQVTANIWRAVLKWMGSNVTIVGTVQQHFLLFGDLIKGKHSKSVKHIIWLATTWCIWRKRNNIIFRGENMNVPSLVDQIIYISWLWFISHIETRAILVFSDWCFNPLNCIQST